MVTRAGARPAGGLARASAASVRQIDCVGGREAMCVRSTRTRIGKDDCEKLEYQPENFAVIGAVHPTCAFRSAMRVVVETSPGGRRLVQLLVSRARWDRCRILGRRPRPSSLLLEPVRACSRSTTHTFVTPVTSDDRSMQAVLTFADDLDTHLSPARPLRPTRGKKRNSGMP
jgi:hypothetical protein